MIPALKKIKGRFLLSYELEKADIFKGFKTYRVKTLWTGVNQLGFRKKFELLVSNYDVKPSDLYVEKGNRWIIDDGAPSQRKPSLSKYLYLRVIELAWSCL